MAFTRRHKEKDATWARAWTADTLDDLDDILAIGGTQGPRRGDVVYVEATGFYYIWRDDDTWFRMEELPTHDLLGTYHGDTVPTAPTVGDVVYADSSDAIGGLDAVFVDGAIIEGMADASAESAFVEGSAFGTLYGEAVTAKWGARNLIELIGSLSGSSVSSVKAYATSGLTLVDNTLTTVGLGAAAWDDAGYWSGGAPSRLTVPTGYAGTFHLVAQAEWPLFVATAYVMIYKNGVKIAECTFAGGAGSQGCFQCVVVDRAVVGDYYELKLKQINSTGSAAIVAGQYSTFLSLVRQ